MTQRYNVAGLTLPHADESSKLYRILSLAMHQQLERSLGGPHCPLSQQPRARHLNRTSIDELLASIPGVKTGAAHPVITDSLQPELETIPQCEIYWNSSHFGLDQVTLFQDATKHEQQFILSAVNLNLIQEASCIEKAGMGYMSRMVMLAESIQERMIYTLFAADETSHFVQLYPFLPVEPSVKTSPFLQMLSEVLEEEDKVVLLFVIQVVLEGWGLAHYRSLTKDCTHEPLRQTLQRFLADESRHHATGVTLFNQASLSTASHRAIVDILAQFLSMVQVGPQATLEAIAKVKGHLSRAQKIKILEELDTEKHSGSRLQLLRSLMKGEGADSIVQDLEDRGSFLPFTAYQCI